MVRIHPGLPYPIRNAFRAFPEQEKPAIWRVFFGRLSVPGRDMRQSLMVIIALVLDLSRIVQKKFP